MRFRCRRQSERGRVPDVDVKPDNRYGNAAGLVSGRYLHAEDIWLILGGVGVGILFLAVSRFTGESMGYGDSWAILILGIYLGLWELLTALTGAFFLLAAVSAAGLAAKKMSKRLRIPFYPFLTAGYLMSVIW